MDDQSKRKLTRRLWQPVRGGFYIQILKKSSGQFFRPGFWPDGAFAVLLLGARFE